MVRSGLDEAALLELARNGDDDAVQLLFATHLPAARRLAGRLSPTPHDADDVVGEATESVLRALRSGHGPTEAFGPYLLTTVRRQSWRRQTTARRQQDLVVTREPAVADAAPDVADRQAVRAALADLPERQRALVWAAEVEGRTPAELAGTAGLSANAVAAATVRARRSLRRSYVHAHLATTAPDACRDALGRLAGTSRGEPTAHDLAVVDDHVAWCDPCREVVEDLAALRRRRRGAVALLAVLDERLRSLPRRARIALAGGAGAGAVVVVLLVVAALTPASPEAAADGTDPGSRTAPMAGGPGPGPAAGRPAPGTGVGPDDGAPGPADQEASSSGVGATPAPATVDARTGLGAGDVGPAPDVGAAPARPAGAPPAGTDAPGAPPSTVATPPDALPPPTTAPPPTTTAPATTPTTTRSPWAGYDVAVVGQATGAPAGMLSEVQVRVGNVGARSWDPSAGAVAVQLVLPAGFTIDTATLDPGWSCTAVTDQLRCTIDAIAPQTWSFATLGVRVPAAATPGTYALVATAALPGADADPANDTLTLLVDVT